jgi:hypothetical protein
MTSEFRDDRFTWKEGDLVFIDPETGDEISTEEMMKRKAAHDAAHGEQWVGPYKIRDLLEDVTIGALLIPPPANSAYFVSQFEWHSAPTPACVPLYVGGNTSSSPVFRKRVGDLLADMFGFYSTARLGHHSGGQSLHAWCKAEHVKPLDLYIAWIEGTACHRCLEGRLYRELQPVLNQKTPSKCARHAG